jgi:hypothetical protein
MGGDGRCIFSTFVDVVGVDALFVAGQKRTSLEMIELPHCPKTTAIADVLEELIAGWAGAETATH